MSGDQDGGVPARQDVTAGGDAYVVGHDLIMNVPPGRAGGVGVHDSQGVQVGGPGAVLTQVNVFGQAPAGVVAATPGEFRSDVLAMLRSVDDWALRSGMPPHLVPGADVLRMARAIRLLGRVRRTTDGGGQDDQERRYVLPAERDERAEDSRQPWEKAAAAHDRLVVLADPGMGKSWLLRLEAHRLATAALALLEQSAVVSGDAAVPVLVRADVLAAAPGRNLAEAAAGYLVGEGWLPVRSAGLMQDLIAGGGAVLLVDALDEVPREAAVPGGQAPRKRLEDLLRKWAERCPGRTRCVLTSRLSGYTGPPVPGMREAELLPFTPTDITAAVRAWDLPAPAGSWLRARLGDPAVAGMARVPLLLALICSLAADPHGRQRDVPQSRAGLYAAVLWQFLSGAHRAAEYGAHAPAVDPAGREDLLRVLTHVAFTFASTRRGWVDRMPRAALLHAIRRSGNALADLSAAPATVLDRLAGETGILVPAGNPASGEQDYVFLHRTIAEYLVARHLSGLPDRRRMAVIEEHQWFDPDWAEVIPMFGGLLASSSPGEARALVTWFLTQRRDPLHYAFRTALRVLGDAPDPDQLLTSAQKRDLHRKTHRLLANGVTRDMLTSVLAAAGTWPAPVTTALLSGLTHQDQDVRGAAARVLAGRDAPEVTAAVLTVLTEQYGYAREAVARALAVRTPESAGALLASLTRKDESWRRVTAEGLADWGAPEPTTAALLAGLTDEDLFIRERTAYELMGRDAPEVTAALLTSLNDEEHSVRSAAAWALAGRDAPEVTAALLALLTDRHGHVRQKVAEALAGRDAPEVTTALLTLLADEDQSVSRAAATALAGRDAPEVTTALLDSLSTGDWYIREAAAAALAGRDTPEVTTALLTCLTEKDGMVCEAAAAALAGRDAPEVTTALLSLLTNRVWTVRAAAAGALAGRDTRKVTTALLTRLTDKERGVREAAAGALAGRDDTAILFRLATSYKWLAWPGRMRESFNLAIIIADRAYLRMPQSSRARIRWRLGHITSRV